MDTSLTNLNRDPYDSVDAYSIAGNFTKDKMNYSYNPNPAYIGHTNIYSKSNSRRQNPRKQDHMNLTSKNSARKNSTSRKERLNTEPNSESRRK